MTNRSGQRIYKSFEQFKSEVFPILSENEKKNSLTSAQIGASMADSAFEKIMKEKK